MGLLVRRDSESVVGGGSEYSTQTQQIQVHIDNCNTIFKHQHWVYITAHSVSCIAGKAHFLGFKSSEMAYSNMNMKIH